MEIVLERVMPDKRDTLFRLLQYSLFEESLTDLNDMNDDALFDYPWFDAYFTEPEREAYFIREKDTQRLLGFAMVRAHEDGRHSIAEFLVIPKYRRRGIGTQAARACFALHEGMWEVKPAYGSEAARLFWQQVINRIVNPVQRKDGLFTFVMKHKEER
ncbi:MAG: GNAT family N-acetyltransferase [Clostridiales bacterium]|nr:GNAT family N-acetyltransferase [Clostridiales bacterium]